MKNNKIIELNEEQGELLEEMLSEYDYAFIKFKMDGNMDPLFVIPRYWDTNASQEVDTVRQIGKSAKEYYNSIRETELEYYDIICKPEMGEL